MIAKVAASLALSLLCLGATARGATVSPRDPRPKTPIVDGSVVHDVGQMLLNITNVGLIGSWPGSSASFSFAPSAYWPAENGHDLLFAAGLWVGGRVEGTPRVSTGQYEMEFYPTDDPLDVIYTMVRGEIGGARYPSPSPDDDGDGLEDEDPKNGLDDDDDGLVDEDFGVIGDQHFRLVNSDLNPAPGANDPTPMGLEVVQQSFQWTDPIDDDFIGFEFTVRNVGEHVLQDVYLGFFADFDIPAGEGEPDELPWAFHGDVASPSGTSVPVSLAGSYGVGEVRSCIGVVLLSHPTDPSGETAPDAVAIRSFQFFNGNLPFDRGGDPTDDAERYDLLARDDWDVVPPLFDEGKAGDYRVLISSGPFPEVEPGQQLTYDLALVAGADFDDLLAHAAAAVEVYQGAAFDRDGDPETGVDGKETVVHWLRPHDVPVAAASGTLRSWTEGTRGIVELEARSIDPDRLRVRRVDADGGRRSWLVGDLAWHASSVERIEARLEDDGVTAWPATYELVYENATGAVVLARSVLTGAVDPALRLTASPNPARSSSTIGFSIPRDEMARLEVYDARGRRVRTLVAGPLVAGPATVVWQGDDAHGRRVAAGTYHVLLTAGRHVARRTVVLRR